MFYKNISLMILFSFLFGCNFFNLPKSYNSNQLIGKWKTELGAPESNAGIWSAICEFKSNGDLIMTYRGSLMSGVKKATFIAQDISSWRIEGENYIDKTKENKIINLEGDPQSKKIIKEIILSDDGQGSIGKILKLTDDIFIVMFKSDDDSDYKMILHKIK